jgi:hypothetical protein
MSTEIVHEQNVVLGEKLDPAEQSNTTASMRASFEARLADIVGTSYPTSHRRNFEEALRAYSSAASALSAAWEEMMDPHRNPNARADDDEANKHYPESIRVSFDEHAFQVGTWYLRMIGEE